MVSDSECLIPGLPNEVATICLAKVPLSFRYRISQVCWSWRNLFKEDYFWDLRREHSACETLLLVWSRNLYKIGVWHGFYPATGEWIRLPLMPRGDMWVQTCSFAVVDDKLFVIGGRERCRSPGKLSAVAYFDLKRYEWRYTSPLNVGRNRCMTATIDNLLYVFGGLIDRSTDRATASTVEVYSPATKTWKFVSSLQCPMFITSSVVTQGKIYAANTHVKNPASNWKGVVYSPEEDEWTEIPEALDSGWIERPIEFNGLICVKRMSMDCKETFILGYNPSDKTWSLVHGQRVIENWIYPWRYPPRKTLDQQLLNLDGRLCLLLQSKQNDTLDVVIEDLTSGHIVSKSFRHCSLTEAEDSQLVPSARGDVDRGRIECLTVRL